MSGFLVRQPGLLSLLHDRGRFGAHKLGLTTGGPLDGVAFDWANRMLVNDVNATCLEISFGGLVLEAQIDKLVTSLRLALPALVRAAISQFAAVLISPPASVAARPCCVKKSGASTVTSCKPEINYLAAVTD
jgi:hypothetical protein